MQSFISLENYRALMWVPQIPRCIVQNDNMQVSVLHQACCTHPVPHPVIPNIVAALLNLGADVDDPDCVGQTPLFYAVTHCQARDIVPLLLAAGTILFTACTLYQ